MIVHRNNWGTAYLVAFIKMLVILGIILPFLCTDIEAGENRKPKERFKVLHIMSYHSPWEWTDEQLRGFKYALKNIDIEYKVFQMDTKRKGSPEWKNKVASEAMHLIDTWNPDLVYANDDLAQELVVKNMSTQICSLYLAELMPTLKSMVLLAVKT